jgi:hypothetical protein
MDTRTPERMPAEQMSDDHGLLYKPHPLEWLWVAGAVLALAGLGVLLMVMG